ncbi:MAG: DUF4232 domain-containing protein [Specibacter sp.]
MSTDPKSTTGRQSTRNGGVAAVLGLVAVVALGLAGCSASSDAPSPSPSTTSSAAATTEASETPSSEAPTTPATTTPAPASASPTATAADALCTAASLSGSLDDSGGGAAGHIYMKLTLKNTSTKTCILDGYPGVSMVNAAQGTPIGDPAVRDAQMPSSGPIALAPGKSSSATLRYTQADNYQDCTRVQADSIMVYPPSAFDRLLISHPLTACSNTNISLLGIGAFQP